VFSRLFAASKVFKERLPSSVRFSWLESSNVFLPFDVASILTRRRAYSRLSDFIQGIAEMLSLCGICRTEWPACGASFVSDVAKGFPHVHHRKTNALDFFSPTSHRTAACCPPSDLLRQTRSEGVSDQVAHDNAIGMPFAD